MNTKQLVSHKFISVMLIGLFTLAASDVRAEYYYSCAGPDYVECVSCGKHRVISRHHYKKYKHRKHRHSCVTRPVVRHSRLKMEVYYVCNTFVPPCAGGDDWVPNSCACRARRYEHTGSIVGFSSAPTPYYNDGFGYQTESSYFYDRGTADDDSYVYPDMNIDH